jgi:hypothetical protein
MGTDRSAASRTGRSGGCGVMARESQWASRTLLVAQDGMNQAAHGLRRGMAGGSFASEEVDQSGFAEEVPGFGPSPIL